MTKYLVPAEDLLWLLNAVATTAHPQKIADLLDRSKLYMGADEMAVMNGDADNQSASPLAKPE
jgi:hypothetical protein